MVTSVTNTRQPLIGGAPTGVTVMSCSKGRCDLVCSGRSKGLIACVTMVEALDVSAALIAESSRVRSTPEKTSASNLPRASDSKCPEAASIHEFQRVTRSRRSRTIRPPLMASSTAFSSAASSAGIGLRATRLTGPLDQYTQQSFEGGQRRKIEQHRDVAFNIAKP